MSLKEITELLKDLIESQKHLTLRLKMIEVEIISIKENLPGRITSIIEKTENFDKKVSQKYIKELLAKKVASKSIYQKGSMDEVLIQKFLEKQKMEEDNQEILETNLEETKNDIKSKETEVENE